MESKMRLFAFLLALTVEHRITLNSNSTLRGGTTQHEVGTTNREGMVIPRRPNEYNKMKMEETLLRGWDGKAELFELLL
jgi:hypothetical protein